MPDPAPDSPPVRVFVSFSSKDDAHLEQLQNHLSALKRQGAIEVWTHHALLPGEKWEPTLLGHFLDAELVILLVSADFMASPYIQEQELAATLERHKRGEVWVTPVLIRAVDIKGTWINDLQTLPAGRKPISQWRTRDEFWTAVAAGLRELLPVLREARQRRSPVKPIGVPASQQAARQEWRVITERLLMLEQAGMAEELLAPLRQRAATLKRQAREGHPLSPGEILDERFLVLELIGQGGFARVWKALDLGSNEVVALKVLKGDFALDPGRRERFRVGIRAMSSLHHPSIVALRGDYREEPGYVTSEGTQRGQYHYCAMEYISGGDLQRYVRQHSPEPTRVLELVCELASALEYAHGQECLHRDVKPANILLTSEGHAKLADFDLAKLGESTHGTRTGALGTLFYAAPELHLSEGEQRVDARADVYSLAMTMVFGLYGRELPYDVMVERSEFISRLPVAEAVRSVILRALQVKPERRYPSMRAFREALENAMILESKPSPEPITRFWDQASYRAAGTLNLGGLRGIRLFLSCPSDVKEKKHVRQLIERLNQNVWKPRGFYLEPLDWEEEVVPQVELGRDPQSIINEQIGRYDIYLGLMWKKFGSPTSRFGSATEEELRIALSRLENGGDNVPRRVMFYFCDRGGTFSSNAEIEQFTRVRALRKELGGLGPYGVWKTSPELIRRLEHDLLVVMEQRIADLKPEPHVWSTRLEIPAVMEKRMTVVKGDTEFAAPALETIATETSSEKSSSDTGPETKSGDCILLVNLESASILTPPAWVEALERQGSIRVVRGPDISNPKMLSLLRMEPTTPLGRLAGFDVLLEMRNAIRSVRDISSRVHIFFQGPHAAAAALGRTVADLAQHLELFLYTVDPKNGSWRLLLRPPEPPVGEREIPRYFDALERVVCDDATFSLGGIALLALFRHQAWTGREKAGNLLLARFNLAEVDCPQPMKAGWIDTPEQARQAVADLLSFASMMCSQFRPRRALHLATDAPTALVLELGRYLPSMAFSAVIVHQFDSIGQQYYPMMDIGGPEITIVR